MKFKFGKLPIKYAPNSKVCELSVLECFRLAIGFFTTKHGNESMLPYTNPLALDVIFHSCWIDFQIQFKCDIIILHSFLELLQGGLLQLHSPTHKDQLDFRIIGLIRKLRLKSLSYKALRWGTSSARTGYGWCPRGCMIAGSVMSYGQRCGVAKIPRRHRRDWMGSKILNHRKPMQGNCLRVDQVRAGGSTRGRKLPHQRNKSKVSQGTPSAPTGWARGWCP
jgi:hypothetical protein